MNVNRINKKELWSKWIFQLRHSSLNVVEWVGQNYIFQLCIVFLWRKTLCLIKFEVKQWEYGLCDKGKIYSGISKHLNLNAFKRKFWKRFKSNFSNRNLRILISNFEFSWMKNSRNDLICNSILFISITILIWIWIEIIIINLLLLFKKGRCPYWHKYI